MPRAFFNPELITIDINVSPTPVWSIIIQRRSWRFSLRSFRYPSTDAYSVPSSNCFSRIRSNSLSRLPTTATAEWSSFCPRSTPATKNLGAGEDGAFSDVLKVLIHASSDWGHTEPAIFVVGELCFHLSSPPPRIGGELSPELLKNLELERPVWFKCVQVTYVVSREVEEVYVVSAHGVEHAFARAGSACCEKPAVRSSQREDRSLIELLVIFGIRELVAIAN